MASTRENQHAARSTASEAAQAFQDFREALYGRDSQPKQHILEFDSSSKYDAWPTTAPTWDRKSPDYTQPNRVGTPSSPRDIVQGQQLQRTPFTFGTRLVGPFAKIRAIEPETITSIASRSSRIGQSPLRQLPIIPNVFSQTFDCRYLEDELKRISEQLKAQGKHAWGKNPRLYTLLSELDCLGVLEEFTIRGFSDREFPYVEEEIADIFYDKEAIPKFLEQQWKVTVPFSELYFLHGPPQDKPRPIERYFREIRKLGPGGSGHVHHVIDQSSGENYARKRINLGLGARSQSQKQRLQNEMLILKRISHTHLIRYVASYVDNRTMGILISPVADMNLATLLDAEGLSQEQRSLLCNFFGCLTAALAYLHHNGVRHKDIKPANVLVKDSSVYLADFGISGPTELRSTTSLFSIPDFTPQYAAPEVANDEARGTPSDMWSVGCVFLEMVAVLGGSSILETREFFRKHGTKQSSYHENLPATVSWPTKIQESPHDPVIVGPIQWCRSLMREDPRSRMSARELMAEIQASTDSSLYIKECCIGEYEEMGCDIAVLQAEECPEDRSACQDSQENFSPNHDGSESTERGGSVRIIQDRLSPVLSVNSDALDWDVPASEDESLPNQSADVGQFLDNFPWLQFPEESRLPTIDIEIGINRSATFIDADAVQRVTLQLSQYCEQISSAAFTEMARTLASLPRVCLLLNLLKRRDLLPHFITSKQSDEGLPFSPRELYELFEDKEAANKFERLQYRCLIRDLESEDITNFSDKEMLPFKKIRDLGSGGWAKVECTKNVISGAIVARKLFPAAALSSKDEKRFRESFEKEIASLKKLSGHQHIVQYVGAYQSSKNLGLLMSPVAECDFHSFLADPDIVEDIDRTDFLARSFGCLASALAFIHGHNIRHKDIKSENILLDCSGSSPNFLFTDFGIANDFSQTKESMTRGPRLQGTLRYCAPEVARLRERATRSDVFSLGCVFLEAVTVLADRPLRDLYESLNEDYIFHESLPEVNLWIDRLSAVENDEVAKALLWCRAMVEEQPEHRPYASQLLNMIAADTRGQDGLRTRFFCDFCLAELRLKHMITVDISHDGRAAPDKLLGESEHLDAEGAEKTPKAVDPITMQYTFETFADVMRSKYTVASRGIPYMLLTDASPGLHILSLAVEFKGGTPLGRAQEIKLSFEMLRLLNWGQILEIHTKRAIPGSDLAENHRTIINIMVQTKTIIETFFMTSSEIFEDYVELVSLQLQPRTRPSEGYDRRQGYLPTSANKFLDSVFAVQEPESILQLSSKSLAGSVHWEDLAQLLTDLSQKNKDLRRLVTVPSRSVLRDRDEETNLELLQLCDSPEELSALVEAVKPALLPSQLHNSGHWDLPEAALEESKHIPGVWNRKALARFARFKAINTRISSVKSSDFTEAYIPETVELERNQLSLYQLSYDYDNWEGEYEEWKREQTFFRTSKAVSMPVWIEWKNFEPGAFDGEPDPLVKLRIRKLTALLWDPHKPREFRVPRCLGYFRDIDPDTRVDYCRYGLVFETPGGPHGSVEPVSLFQLYRDTQIPQIPERLSLALAVSRCVLYLHAANWLHKGLNSNSTIFFRHRSGRIDFSSPFLSGFDYSRPAQNEDLTEKPPENAFLDIYRHPHVQGSRGARSELEGPGDQGFRKFYDIYSLGIILIEIANWLPISHLLKLDLRKARPSATLRVRGRLLNEPELLRTIHLSLGPQYVELVKACLIGPEAFGFGEDTEDERTPVFAANLQSAFYNTVVKGLQEISTASA